MACRIKLKTNVIYTHCMAHHINLVVIDMCKHVKVNQTYLLLIMASYLTMAF